MSFELMHRHQQSTGEVTLALIAASALLRSLEGMIERTDPADWPLFVESALKGRMDDLRKALS